MCDVETLKVAEKHAELTYEKDFFFCHKLYLFRAKLTKTGKLKVKEICSAIPSLIGVSDELKGTDLFN